MKQIRNVAKPNLECNHAYATKMIRVSASTCLFNLFVWCLEAHQEAPSAEKQLGLFRSACVRVLKTLPVSFWLKACTA